MPDDPKVAEFRETNIKQAKTIEEQARQIADLTTKYDGIDPEIYRTLAAKAGTDDSALTTLKTTLATRDTELATERTAHADTRKRADALVIDNAIADAFLKSGGRAEARAFIIAQAAGQFTVADDGTLKGTKFSPARAGEPMSVDEWIMLQSKQNGFCFHPSSGGGANPRSGNPSAGGRVVKNPSPNDLGKLATEIANGSVRVVYE